MSRKKYSTCMVQLPEMVRTLRIVLLARRLAERGVRFIQLYHRGWDHHGDLVKHMKHLLSPNRQTNMGVSARSQTAWVAR